MAKLTDEEKLARRIDRAFQHARTLQLTTCRKEVATQFQLMIRAEAGARVGSETVYRAGKIMEIQVGLGECACVTCGIVFPYKGDRTMNAGHFLAGRRVSILFEETGVNPQCANDNVKGGMPEAYQRWMLAVHGPKEIERLCGLKHQREAASMDRDTLARLKIWYADRAREAELAIRLGQPINPPRWLSWRDCPHLRLPG